MKKYKERPPIEIPKDLAKDRGTKRLLVVWKNSHARYRVCCKRVNWRNDRATKVEKIRRREKWKKVAIILETERVLIRWCAQATHHSDIWTSKRISKSESLLKKLYREYDNNRRADPHLVGIPRKKNTARRQLIVAQIRAIMRDWMVALSKTAFPNDPVPKPITLHATELYPRKVVVAKQWLDKELE